MRKFMNIIKQYILIPVENGFRQSDSFLYFITSLLTVVLITAGVVHTSLLFLPWWGAMGVIIVSLLVLVNYFNGREGS
jgi:hypothetical protein